MVGPAGIHVTMASLNFPTYLGTYSIARQFYKWLSDKRPTMKGHIKRLKYLNNSYVTTTNDFLSQVTGQGGDTREESKGLPASML